MRRISPFRRLIGNSLVALLTVAAVESTARAQHPAASPGEVVTLPSSTLDDEPPEAANDSADLDVAEEAESEEESPPSFGGPIYERSKLTGDWLGMRTGLEEHGITLDVVSTQYDQGVTSGGLEQAFQYGGRNDYFLNVDAEKLGLWNGASVTLHGESRYGETANTIGGTLLAPNLLMSVPLPDETITALTGVTFNQYLSEKLLIYGGKLNTLDDYFQPLTGADNYSGFLNTAMLYNPVFARTVPYSTFGAGFVWLDNEETVFGVTVYDTNDTPTVSGFETFFDNGATVYAEWNLRTTFCDRPGNHGLSGTYSSGKYSSLTPAAYLDPIEGLVIVPRVKSGSWCLAYNVDQALYVAPDDPERMWGVFGNFGIADDNPSPVSWFASAGISGASLIARRTADTFGCAYFYLGVSEPLKELAPNLLPLGDEHGMELYYNVALTPWCQITPDLQWIRPFRERADTALIVGLRAKIDF